MSRYPEWADGTVRDRTQPMEPERDLELRLKVTRSGVLSFGHVPENWRVVLEGLGKSGPGSLEAEEVGHGVQWLLMTPGIHQIHLGHELRKVHVQQPTSKHVRLELSRSSSNLYLDPAWYSIDHIEQSSSPVNYKVWTQSSNPTSEFSFTGSALLTSLTGCGKVQVPSLSEITSLNFDGSISVDGAVEIDDLAIAGDFKCHSLKASRITASTITASNPRREANSFIEIRESIKADCVSTPGLLRSANRSNACLTVGRSLSVDSMTDMRVIAKNQQARDDGKTAPREVSVVVHGKVENSTFANDFSSIIAGRAKGNLRIESAKLVKINNSCQGSVYIKAEKVEVASLLGSGTVRARSIIVNKSAVGEAPGLSLRADDTLTVGASASSVVLVCDSIVEGSRLVVGRDNSYQPNIINPSREAGKFEPGQIHYGVRVNDQESVTHCIIKAQGDVEIATGVKSSVLEVEGRLTVNGDVDLESGLNEVPTHVSGQASVLSSNLDWFRTPCRVGSIVTNGILKLNASIVVIANLWVSARNLCGSLVTVKADDGYIVLGDCDNARIEAAEVYINGNVSRSHIIAATELRITKGITKENSVITRGNAVLSREVKGKLCWRPTQESTLDLVEGAEDLQVQSLPDFTDGGIPTLRLPGPNALKLLQLEGTVAVYVPETGTGISIGPWKEIRLGKDACLQLPKRSMHLGRVQVTHDARLVLQTSVRMLLHSNENISPVTLRIIGRGNAIFDPSNRVAESEPEHLPRIVLCAESSIDVGCRLSEVECDSIDQKTAAIVSVRKDGVIEHLSGQFKLGMLNGRISSNSKNGRGLASLSGTVPRAELTKRNIIKNDTKPEDFFTHGRLLNIDVSHASFADIRALTGLDVFEPHGRTLMQHAQNNNEKHKPERAQRLKDLAEAVAGSAAPGATRSAALWAAARAHHSTVSWRTHPIESLMRLLHRCVGYGYRPGPAAICYLIWSLVVALSLWTFDNNPVCSQSADSNYIGGNYGLGNQVLRVLFLPASFLRLDQAGALGFAPIACNVRIHIPVLAVTAIILVFLGLSIRNYLRTPKDN